VIVDPPNGCETDRHRDDRNYTSYPLLWVVCAERYDDDEEIDRELKQIAPGGIIATGEVVDAVRAEVPATEGIVVATWAIEPDAAGTGRA
jgi:hypothetical protein